MSSIAIHQIKTDGHPVVFGRHSLAQLAEHLAHEHLEDAKVFILVDENTLKHCLPSLISKVPLLSKAEIIEVDPGEESKAIEVASKLWDVLAELGADRNSILLNLGGGVITDLGGFIAGTFKRGIRFFNVPTSLLAQVDASIGGKTGINHGGIKNQIGLFVNPQAVYVDPEFISTLPRNQVLSGFSEMLKHALIFDPSYYSALKEVSFFDITSLDEHILSSLKIKNQVVGSDPLETGTRKILNFGHTIGHAVESYSSEGDFKTLLHGEAIAIGMVCEAFISKRMGHLSETQLTDITSFIFSIYPKVNIERMMFHRLIELMRHDKKNADGKIRMTLLEGIGSAIIDQTVSAELIVDSLNYYSRWTG